MLLTRALPPTLDLLRLQRLAPDRYPLLLESSAHGTAQGRWDLLLAGTGQALRLDRDGQARDQDGRTLAAGFLPSLDAAWQAERTVRDEPRWPFRGGWALWLGYELAAQVEPVLDLPAAAGVAPIALALRCPAAILRDHATGECIAVAEPAHADFLERLSADAAAAHALADLPAWTGPAQVEEDAPARYVDGVQRVIDYLRAGDVFQVNLSRGWRARFPTGLDPAALFQRLRSHNPAPFAGVFVQPDWAVVSASPERLVSVRGDVVETRPSLAPARVLPATTTPRASRNWSAIRRSAPST
jgi:anthranilate synthase component 1